MVKETLADTEAKMKKSIEALRNHLATIRTGRAAPALVEQIMVEYYGATMPISQLANISTPDARMLVVQPWDKNALKAIEKGIQNSDLGINPNNDGQVIRLSVPPLTEQRRKDLTKSVKKEVEESKVALRNVRRDALGELKKMETEKQITPDESKRGQEKLQEVTDKYAREMDAIGAAKEAEVMEV